MTVYLNIGSNQGDRQARIEQAVALIAEAYPVAELRLSHPMESEPWGYESENMFLNVGMALDFDGDVEPMALLDVMQQVERRVDDTPHRNADGTYRDRGIDIDIICIDRIEIDTERLKLPHPRASQRPFVMLPLTELAPAELVAWLWRLQQ